MAGVVQSQATGFSEPGLVWAVVGELAGAERLAQSTLGEGEVDLGEDVDGGGDVGGAFAHGFGEIAQDALHLSPLLQAELAPLVAHLDDLKRLQEDGGAGGGDVVDDSRYLGAHLRLDGDDVAAIAQGDDRLLEGAAVGARADELLQAMGEAVVGLADVAAELGEDGRGVVHDLRTLVNGAADAALDLSEVDDAFGDLGKEGELDPQAGEGAADASRQVEGGVNV